MSYTNHMALGRPRIEFDQQIADDICELIATTDLGLEDVLAELKKCNPKIPSFSTIYKWMRENESFMQNSARARELQGDTIIDQAIKEARTVRIHTITRETERGIEVTTQDNVQRSQLIVQTLMKRAGQLNSKKYSDKVVHQGDSENPVEMIVRKVGSKA